MIIVILLILILFLLYDEYKESFTYFNPVNSTTPKAFLNIDNYFRINLPSTENTTSIFQNRMNLIPTTFHDISGVQFGATNKLENDINNFTTNYVQLKSNKCCLIKKVLNGESFNYEYQEYKDNECDLNNFELDHNNQLFFDGESGWTNDKCSNEKSDLGSCRHYDFECIDFVSKDKCNEYNKRMPPDPQHRKITYNWENKACYSRY